ncbi:SUKH-3 domain-containing protein [Candidatus Parabeggiatoa sp. HSG14]|uniref:SUKH-3 domain-containing protein n=1 Tax=Candidatus Parabeggiatoa sp. HSG14 TaxID=3055593 RepID=UPI0025A8BDA4|nr:SUKH-3 domain-containing protein [Thiotrichales bacterium HSG14]
MSIFSQQTLNDLYQAGWYKGRKCQQFSEYKHLLNQEEFELSDSIEQFLKSFGGLFIKCSHNVFEQLFRSFGPLLATNPHAKVRDATSDFHFDVIKAVHRVDSLWVSVDYSERIGEPLCTIGDAFRGDMVLSMSLTGKVYAGADDFLVYVGASGEEAIEALCTGRELEKVPELTTPLEITVDVLNYFFKRKRIQERLRFFNEHGNDWLEAEFAFFLSQTHKELEWRKQRQTDSLNDIFDFAFSVAGKHYAMNINQYRPTQLCLKKIIEGNGKKWFTLTSETQHTDQFNNNYLVMIGVHPKTEMKKAEIKKYIVTEAKNVGLEILQNRIKTTFIPKTDYAHTVFTIER